MCGPYLIEGDGKSCAKSKSTIGTQKVPEWQQLLVRFEIEASPLKAPGLVLSTLELIEAQIAPALIYSKKTQSLEDLPGKQEGCPSQESGLRNRGLIHRVRCKPSEDHPCILTSI